MTRIPQFSFRQALVVNQLPIWICSLLGVVATMKVLTQIDIGTDHLVDRMLRGDMSGQEVERLAGELRMFWLSSFTFFLVVAALATLLSYGLYSHVQRRVDRLLDYARRRAAGEDVEEPRANGNDVLGDLERSIVQITTQMRDQEEQLRRDGELARSDAQLRRAFELSDNEQDLLETARHAISKLLPQNQAELLLADSSRDHLRRVAGDAEERMCAVQQPMDCPAIRAGKTLRFPDSEAIDACPNLRGRGCGSTGAVCSPLNIMGQTVGVVHITSKPEGLPDDDQSRLLDLAAGHAGSRLTMLRTLQTTQQQAQTDPLTGLLNRRSFTNQVSTALRDSRGTHALAMIDLDHFKNLNDTHGHDAGDRALKLFSRVVKRCLRPQDVVGRHGGEEFVVFVSEADSDTARTVLERVREKLALAVDRYNGPAFTASFGVSLYPADGRELEDLITEADQMLYQAKDRGRDCIVTSMDSAPPPPEPERHLKSVEGQA